MSIVLSGVSSTSSISTLSNTIANATFNDGGVFGNGPLSSASFSSTIVAGPTTILSVSLVGVSSSVDSGQLGSSNAVESYALTSILSHSTITSLSLAQTTNILSNGITSSIGVAPLNISLALSGATSTSHISSMLEGHVRPLTNVTSIASTNKVTPNINRSLLATSTTSSVGIVIEGDVRSLSGNTIVSNINNLLYDTSSILSSVQSTGVASNILQVTEIGLLGIVSTGEVGNAVYSKVENLSAVSSTSSIGSMNFAENVYLTNTTATSSIGQISTNVPDVISGVYSSGVVNTLIAKITPVKLSSVSSTTILGKLPLITTSEFISSSITSVTPISEIIPIGTYTTSIVGTLIPEIIPVELEGESVISGLSSIEYELTPILTGISSITSPEYIGFATGMMGISCGALSDGPIGGSASVNVTWESSTVGTTVIWTQVPKYNPNIIASVLNVSPDDISGFGAFAYATTGSLYATTLNNAGEPLGGLTLIGNVGTLSILYPTLSGVSSIARISKYMLVLPKINDRYYISARSRTTVAQVQNKYT